MKKEDNRTPESLALEKRFLEAYDEHADALFRHCLIRVRDRDVAKDLVQETYSKTWLYLSQGKKIEHIRAFLFRVANNLIIDGARRKKSSSLDSMMEEDGFEIKDDSLTDPGDIADAKGAMKLLTSLDEIYRVVISMRFIDGLSPKEIATALRVSENVVSVRLHRGMDKLKKIASELGIRA